jgi:hypothetical protein
MPKISTVAQGGAQRSEQYLEARTGEGARAACPPAAAGAIMRQPSGCGFARRKSVSGATRANTESPAASERIHTTDGAASLTNSHRFERARSSRRCGSGVQATSHERREESAQVEARQGRRCRDPSLRRGAILANGRARTTNRQRRPIALEPRRLRPQRMAGAEIGAGAPER